MTVDRVDKRAQKRSNTITQLRQTLERTEIVYEKKSDSRFSEMPPPPLLLPNPAGYQYPSEGLSDVWKPSESPTRVKARLDGLEVIEPVIGMMPESPTRVKARLDGLDQLPNKQFVLPVSISASRLLFLLSWRKKQ